MRHPASRAEAAPGSRCGLVASRSCQLPLSSPEQPFSRGFAHSRVSSPDEFPDRQLRRCTGAVTEHSSGVPIAAELRPARAGNDRGCLLDPVQFGRAERLGRSRGRAGPLEVTPRRQGSARPAGRLVSRSRPCGDPRRRREARADLTTPGWRLTLVRWSPAPREPDDLTARYMCNFDRHGTFATKFVVHLVSVTWLGGDAAFSEHKFAA
jgi:hypothetical protein